MFITFTPTNETVEVGGMTGIIPQFTVGLGELSAPVYETPSGYTPVQTVLDSGSPAQILAGAAQGYYVRFFNGMNKTLLVTKFQVDDSDALTNAENQILGALAGGAPAIRLAADGEATWVAPAS